MGKDAGLSAGRWRRQEGVSKPFEEPIRERGNRIEYLKKVNCNQNFKREGNPSLMGEGKTGGVEGQRKRD